MLFGSYRFVLIFLPTCLLIHGLLGRWAPSRAVTRWWLVIASAVFFFDPRNPSSLALLVASAGMNFAVGTALARRTGASGRRWLLTLGVLGNVGLLVLFKSQGLFFARPIIYPLAISFYTLQQITFLMDVYEGLIEAPGALDYALYVLFFPKLLAGPIVHYGEMMPQTRDPAWGRLRADRVAPGAFLFVLGLSKKVLIADTFAPWVNEGFLNAAHLHFFWAWATSLGYVVQLYFDFSGYSDMALGLALVFGITLPENFRSPLCARNLVEFWSRWHITLTNFIMSYLFVPLCRLMPKLTFGYSMLAILLAMTIAGVWHGNGMTYLVFGLMHGAGLVAVHLAKRRKVKLPKPVAQLVTFAFLTVGYVVFRAASLTEAWEVLRGLAGLRSVKFPAGLLPRSFTTSLNLPVINGMNNTDNLQLALTVLALGLIYGAPNSMELLERFRPTRRLAFGVGVLASLCLFGMNRISQFIYFKF